MTSSSRSLRKITPLKVTRLEAAQYTNCIYNVLMFNDNHSVGSFHRPTEKVGARCVRVFLCHMLPLKGPPCGDGSYCNAAINIRDNTISTQLPI